MKTELRPRQHSGLAMMKDSIRAGNSRLMMQAPTGFGKTVMGAAIVEGALKKGNKVMFVVPAISLINQTVAAFIAEGITDIGVIQADHPLTNYSKPVQVASIQTLQRRNLSKLPHVQVVVIDEAHRWFEFVENWFKTWSGVIFVGLSATPWTKGLGKHYTDLLIPATTQQLIDEGHLCDFKVYAPSHPDLDGVKIVAGDYHEGQLSEVMSESSLVSDVVTNWKRRGQNRPTLCFGVDRAHAKKLQTDFLNAGIAAEYIDAFTEVTERERIARAFHDGSVKVVCNVGCLTTGIDWDVRCIILARPTKSEILFVQMIGRGLRLAEGKDFCLILDHSDTHLRLGFVTDILHSTLDDGKHAKSTASEKPEPLPKDCGKCGFIKPPKTHECPQCGFKPEKQSEIEPAEGELAELTRTQMKHNKQNTPESKMRFYGELKQYAADKGYKQGWAANKYRDKFGVYPNKYKNAAPQKPSPETLSWIRGTNLRFIKGQQKARSAA